MVTTLKRWNRVYYEHGNTTRLIVLDLILSLKYLAILLLMVLFPSESIMPLSGHLASGGHISLPVAILAGTIGTTLGSTALYALFRILPRSKTEQSVVRYGRWFGLSSHNIEVAGRWFDRHSYESVFFSRFVPGVRSAISLPAGTRRMPFAPFFVLTFCGSLVWVSLLTYLGYIANTEYQRIQSLTTVVSNTIAVLVCIAALGYIYWRRRQ